MHLVYCKTLRKTRIRSEKQEGRTPPPPPPHRQYFDLGSALNSDFDFDLDLDSDLKLDLEFGVKLVLIGIRMCTRFWI